MTPYPTVTSSMEPVPRIPARITVWTSARRPGVLDPMRVFVQSVP